MELNYIKEHTSCVNYKTEEYSGFSLGQALTGENFDNQEQEIKANHLIFILSGEVEIPKMKMKKQGCMQMNLCLSLSRPTMSERLSFREDTSTLLFSITTFPYAINTC